MQKWSNLSTQRSVLLSCDDRGGRTTPQVLQTLSSNSTPLMSFVRRTVSSGSSPSTHRVITPGSENAPTAMATETRTQRRTPKTSTAGEE
eukprot:scaffold34510_cov52-Phaeocystis_antarctica.AAC.4